MASQAEAATAPGPGIGEAGEDLLATFVGPNAEYYRRRFQRLSENLFIGLRANWAAVIGGPLWAAARGLWGLFWFGLVGEVVALIVLGRGLWGPREDEQAAGVEAGLVVGGIVLLVAVKALEGLAANWVYQRRFARWRIDRKPRVGLSQHATVAGAALMAFIYPLSVYRFSAREVVDAIADFPTTRAIHIGTAKAIDAVTDFMIINFEGFFNAITVGVRAILDFLELIFVGTPWPVMALVLLLIAWRVAGWRVALFTAVALAYLGFYGFWEMAMSTISLVGASVFICVLFGTPLGVWCAKSARVNTIVKPILDFMQTMPSFVYLIPAVAFFGIGKPPGVLATVIFAMAPMIRLTTLGIQQVPAHVKEGAIAFGASPRQLLFKIELPLSIPAIMTGINQTIMMSLSMVVVAALIGAAGLGYEVVRALRHMETGKGVLAGIAIVFCAMILDRIVQGSRERGGGPRLG